MSSLNTSEKPTVLIIGATGYIGGSILVALVARHPELTYTAIVRNLKDVKPIESLNVRVVPGSTTDVELVERVASEHDVVFNCADCDDLALTDAIIKGLSTRASKKDTARKPIYIHTSGSAVAADRSPGIFADIKILDDNKEEDIRNIDPKQPHRNVDLQIFAAGEQGAIDTYIIAPSTVYGTGRGPVRKISQQVNGIVLLALQNQQVLQLGPGTGEWNNVHIDDLTDLFVLVLEDALASSDATANPAKTTSAYGRFFWGSARTHVWGDISKRLAVLLHKKGLVTTDEVKSVPLEVEPRLLFVSNNSRTVANRGLKVLGWKPTAKSLEDSLEEEIDLTIAVHLKGGVTSA